MSRTTSQTRHLAKRIIIFETNRRRAGKTASPEKANDCHKLRPFIAALMGEAGFNTLFNRARSLASAEEPWLRNVYLDGDGKVELPLSIDSRLSTAEFFEGRVVLLAQFIGLMVALIGEKLTLDLVHRTWPEVPLNNLGITNEATNES